MLLVGCGQPKLNVVPTGRLVLEPVELAFGPHETLGQSELQLSVLNEGKLAVSVHALGFKGPSAAQFSARAELPLTVEGASQVTIPVEFHAGATAAQHVATLELEVEGAEQALYSVPLSGEAVEPVEPMGLRWIAFDSNRASGNVDLYVVRADGSQLKRLTQEPSVETEPAFSPSGTEVAFASDRHDFTMNIFVMTLATGAVRQLTRATDPSSQPAWSHDGTRLTFHRGIGVYTIAADGTDERHVIDGLNPLNAYQHPSFLPGDMWILMDRGNEIDMVRPDGTGLRQVVENTTTRIETPSAAPSGSTIAFAAFCGGGFSVRSASTSGNTTACGGAAEVQFPGRRPAWGPEHIAYESDEANSEIMIVPAAGGAAVNLSHDAANDRNPAWAPDGTVIR